MKTDIKNIEYNELFNEIDFDNLDIHKHGITYAEKCYNEYLHPECLNEICENEFIPYKKYLEIPSVDNQIENASFAIRQVLKFKEDIFKYKEFEKAVTFVDFYEITLQSIYYYLLDKGEIKKN